MENSIFGILAPQFYCPETDQTVDLDHIEMPFEEKFDDGLIEHESVITGLREWDDLGTHLEIKMKMFLYKYESPVDKYNELLSHKRKLVELKRRRDGEAFAGLDGEIVLFRFDKIVPDVIELLSDKDVLYLTFISQDPINYSSTLKDSSTESGSPS